jgi:hypothetical protein
MAKRITVTSKQKAAAAIAVKRSATSGRFVTQATKAIANAGTKTGRSAATNTRHNSAPTPEQAATQR